GVFGALRRSLRKQQEFFLLVARRAEHVARRAVESGTPRNCSGSCASRRMMWRGAQLENSKQKGITVTCASRRTGGAARQHGNL
ncbi:hypothetical protein A2U01_0049872, partial [Trifolium medium]|nr:hypothetical protein [Trifolium medium]